MKEELAPPVRKPEEESLAATDARSQRAPPTGGSGWLTSPPGWLAPLDRPAAGGVAQLPAARRPTPGRP
jgi:hypothetical protein